MSEQGWNAIALSIPIFFLLIGRAAERALLDAVRAPAGQGHAA